MGVYIKDMEMPNHCGECGIEWCERWKRLIVAGMPSAKARPEDCHLVPVPAHGRLIDKDALEADISASVVFSGRDGNAEIVGAKKIINRLHVAPTVIEAEEVKES